MYSAPFLMELYTFLPIDLMRVITVFAILFSIFSLSLLGGILRHATNLFDAKPKPWGIDISIGLAVAAAWFILRSLTHHLLSFPPILEQEASIIVVLTAALFNRRLLRRSLKEMFSLPSFFALGVIITSIWSFGYWRAFELLPASSDPGVIAVLLDTYRNAGHTTFSFSAFNPNIQNYPNGIMTLGWAFANPMLTSMSIIHLWPHLSLTLLLLVVFDWLAGTRGITNRQWYGVLGLVLIVRLAIGSFDISTVWSYLEGASKRSVGFLCALSLAVTCISLRKSEKSTNTKREIRQGFYNFFSLWPLTLVTMVNPINAYLSASIGLINFSLQATKRTFYTRASILGLIAFFVCTTAMILQDPFLTKQLGQTGPSCKLLSDVINYCQWTPAEIDAAKNSGVETNFPNEKTQAWTEHLPSYFANPMLLLYPMNDRMFHDYPSSINGLIALVSIAVILILRMTFIRRQRLRIARISTAWPHTRKAALTISALSLLGAVSILVFLGFAAAQVYAFSNLAGSTQFLVKSYSEVAFTNIWQILFFAATTYLCTLIAVSTEKQLLIKPRNTRLVTLRFSALMATWAVIVLILAKENLNQTLTLRTKAGTQYGLYTRELASILMQLAKRIPPNETIMLASQMYEAGPELWNMPTAEAIAFQLYLPNPVLFSYSGQWPLGSVPVRDHFRNMCGSKPCEYLWDQKAQWLIAMGDSMKFCGFPGDQYATRVKCFDHKFTINSRKGKLLTQAYTLRPPASFLQEMGRSN